MTPHLVEALARLSPLSAAELSVLSATAATLAAQASPVAGNTSASNPPLPVRSEPPRHSITRCSATAAAWPARHEGSRLDLLGTTSWATVETVDPALFSTATYRARLGDTVPTLLYIAGCDGLRTLADRIGKTLFKGPGLTEGDSVAPRLSTLAAERYGSCVRMNGSWIEQSGFDHFQAVGLPLQRRRGRLSPIRPALRAIAIERPASLPLRVLDRALTARVETASLQVFTRTPEARDICAAKGVDHAELERFSPPTLGRSVRRGHSRATELAILGPRADADRLADLVEGIIATHVMGDPTAPSPRHTARGMA